MVGRIADFARFVFFMFVVFAISEFALRFFNIPGADQQFSPELSEPHPYFGWALRPGVTEIIRWRDKAIEIRHTAQGIRGSQVISEQRPPWAKRRLMFVGDSVLYGLGSSDHETFPALLKATLPNTEIINTGVPGYGTRHELAVIDIWGEKLRPDLIVIIFRWNDTEDNLKADSPSYEFNDSGQVMRTDIAVPDDFNPLLQHRQRQLRQVAQLVGTPI